MQATTESAAVSLGINIHTLMRQAIRQVKVQILLPNITTNPQRTLPNRSPIQVLADIAETEETKERSRFGIVRN